MSAATSASLTEVFLGFYALTETSGAHIAAIIPDVLLHLHSCVITHMMEQATCQDCMTAPRRPYDAVSYWLYTLVAVSA